MALQKSTALKNYTTCVKKKEKLAIFVVMWIANTESYLTMAGLLSLLKKEKNPVPIYCFWNVSDAFKSQRE